MSRFTADKADLFGKGGPASKGHASTATAPKTFGGTFTTPSAAGAGRGTSKPINLAKLKEAEEYRLKAQKAIKTSIMGNWKPDFLGAAPYFDKAGALFKGVGADEQAKEMYLKSAECNEKTCTFAAAAAAFRNASALAKNLSDEEEAATLLSKEGNMWILGGDTGRAADSLIKAAVMVEDTSSDMAIDYCMQACELLFPEGGDPMELARAPMASDIFAKALSICLQLDRVREGLKVAGKAAAVLAAQGMTSSQYKMYCTQTILQLYLGDLVAADQTFMQVHLQNNGYLRSNECECAETLINAAKSMSNAELQSATSRLGKAYLDNSIVKLAKRLTIDRVTGLGEDDEEEDDTGVSSLEAAGAKLKDRDRDGVTPPPRTAAGTGKTKGGPVDVDPDDLLSEDEQKALKAKAVPGRYTPSPSPSPPPPHRPTPSPINASAGVSQPRKAPASHSFNPPPQTPNSPDQSTSGMIDLSDLQASLDDQQATDEELDALIAQAKAASSQAEAMQNLVRPQQPPSPPTAPTSSSLAPSLQPPPPSQPPQEHPPQQEQHITSHPPPVIPTSAHPSGPPLSMGGGKEEGKVKVEEPTRESWESPYDEGYQLPPVAHAPQPGPSAQKEEEDQDDFDLR